MTAARDVAAVLAYRADPDDRGHLEVLRADGLRGVAWALTMEGWMPEDRRARYTAVVEAWLREQR